MAVYIPIGHCEQWTVPGDVHQLMMQHCFARTCRHHHSREWCLGCWSASNHPRASSSPPASSFPASASGSAGGVASSRGCCHLLDDVMICWCCRRCYGRVVGSSKGKWSQLVSWLLQCCLAKCRCCGRYRATETAPLPSTTVVSKWTQQRGDPSDCLPLSSFESCDHTECTCTFYSPQSLSLSLFCQLIGLQMHPQYTKWTNKALQNIIRLKAIRYIYHCYCYYY